MTENSQILNNLENNNIINNSIPLVSEYKQNSEKNLSHQKNSENDESLKISEIDDKDKEIMKLKNSNALLKFEIKRLKSQIKLLDSMNTGNEQIIKEIKKINKNNIISFSNEKNELKTKLATYKNENDVLKNEIENLKNKVRILLIALNEKDVNYKKLREHNTKMSIKFEETLESYKINNQFNENRFNENKQNYLLNSMQEKKTKKNFFYDDLKYINKTTIENVNSSSDVDYENDKINKTVINSHNKISNKFDGVISKNKNLKKEDKNTKIGAKKRNVISDDECSVGINDEYDEKKNSSNSSDNV